MEKDAVLPDRRKSASARLRYTDKEYSVAAKSLWLLDGPPFLSSYRIFILRAYPRFGDRLLPS